MRAWLIRHGQSESNAGLPTNGPSATSLTAIGRAQSERVAEVFTEPPALIVASPFIRARQSAEPTRRRFPGVPYEEWPVQEFTYLGELHGPSTTWQERRPYVEAYWERCDPTYVNGGDGESFAELMGRADDLLGRIATRPEGLVAVFTHGLFMRALIWSVLTGIRKPDAAAMRDYRRFAEIYVLPNGGIVDLRLTGGRPAVVGGAVTHLPARLITGEG